MFYQVTPKLIFLYFVFRFILNCILIIEKKHFKIIHADYNQYFGQRFSIKTFRENFLLISKHEKKKKFKYIVSQTYILRFIR